MNKFVFFLCEQPDNANKNILKKKQVKSKSLIQKIYLQSTYTFYPMHILQV